jgi:hypothetical protein
MCGNVPILTGKILVNEKDSHEASRAVAKF